MAFGSRLFPRQPGPERLLNVLLAFGTGAAVVLEAALVVRSAQPSPRPRPAEFDDDSFAAPAGAEHEWSESLLHEATEHLSTTVLLLVALAALLTAAGVLLRRRWPWLATALAGAGAVVGAVVLGLPIAVTLAYALVVYSLAVERGWIAAAIASAAGFATMLIALVAADPEDGAAGLVLVYLLVAVVVPLLSAAATRSRRAYLGEVEDRLRRVDREHEAETARTLAEERVRLARDLHDVLAHSLTVVNMQVGVASHLLATHPDRAAHALDEAKAAGAAAVAELRTTLALLRGDEPDGLAPVPTLADIPAMVDRVRATGLPVTLQWQVSAPEQLDSTIGLLAFRIVQEGLTNVVKHAGADARTLVTVVGSPADTMSITVHNAPGAAPPPIGQPGIGLEGLRARVHAVGGGLRAQPTPDGGFVIDATLPANSTTPHPQRS